MYTIKTMKTNNQPPKLSTFAGVFTPNILTILGVIMFLRMGFVVGNAGLKEALIILFLAHAVSILTSFSVSTIASNMPEIKGGGDYFLISRSIGIGYGGAIGVILYFAQTTSIAMYIIGFMDALVMILPFLASFQKILSIIVLGLLFIPTYKGADIASKMQQIILVILTLAIVVFMYSGFTQFSPELLKSNINSDYLPTGSFWIMFALFFPAVTGFTQGVSLSGALKNPKKSIPLGTFAAVLVGLIIYGIEMVLLAGTASHQDLVSNYAIMQSISIIPIIIVLGVLSATLSSALGSFMGAPFILQAIAKDRLFPGIGLFGSTNKNEEPKRATILTLIIAGVCIILADLNTLAPIISMFFLVSYGMTNFATFIESYSKNPSFRPTFKLTHWTISLAGLLLVVFIMLKIDPLSAITAFLVLIGLQLILRRKQRGEFKDARTGYYFQKTKEYLIKLQSQPQQYKNWRPQLLLFLKNQPNDHDHLINFGIAIESNRGFFSLIQLIPDSSDISKMLKNKTSTDNKLQNYIKEKNIKTLGDVTIVDNYVENLKAIIQTHGFKGFKPNTIIFDWDDLDITTTTMENESDIELMQFSHQMGKNLILYHGDTTFLKQRKIIIDVWWRGKGNGSLMLLFAYLISQSKRFSKFNIRLLRIVNSHSEHEKALKELQSLTKESRLDAEIIIITKESKEIRSIIIDRSQNSDLVFMGLSFYVQNKEDFLMPYRHYKSSFKNLALVKSWEKGEVLE
jgi:amino acid transporter